MLHGIIHGMHSGWMSVSLCSLELHTLMIYPKMYFYSPKVQKFTFLVASGKCTWLAQNRNKDWWTKFRDGHHDQDTSRKVKLYWQMLQPTMWSCSRLESDILVNANWQLQYWKQGISHRVLLEVMFAVVLCMLLSLSRFLHLGCDVNKDWKFAVYNNK